MLRQILWRAFFFRNLEMIRLIDEDFHMRYGT